MQILKMISDYWSEFKRLGQSVKETRRKHKLDKIINEKLANKDFASLYEQLGPDFVQTMIKREKNVYWGDFLGQMIDEQTHNKDLIDITKESSELLQIGPRRELNIFGKNEFPQLCRLKSRHGKGKWVIDEESMELDKAEKQKVHAIPDVITIDINSQDGEN